MKYAVYRVREDDENNSSPSDGNCMTKTLVSPSGLKIKRGKPLPFGPSWSQGELNLALYSAKATSVTLGLFSPTTGELVLEIALDPEHHKTGEVWHLALEGLGEGYHYAYRVDGPFDPTHGDRFDKTLWLLDPYAPAIATGTAWGKVTQDAFRKGILQSPESFDWGGDKAPGHEMSDLIIYEMHVRGFTNHSSSQVSSPGTFLGMIEKIPYLKALGINAIELLPVHEFNEGEIPASEEGKKFYNYWGYSTVNFFAVMERYAHAEGLAAREFKEMVRKMHENGIEVILDVVFNHSAEGNENGPTLSYRGLANDVYYLLTEGGGYQNFSGCGNTFNCNHPVVRQLIHDSLRYWVTEMHVDGFRFDLASILGRSTDGTPLSNPPLLERIALDPVLAKTKLIAEAWDAGGLYQVGNFPSWGVWAEWNGKYRDAVRRFIKGTDGQVSEFATRLCGSQDLYGHERLPWHSINFITCHDGFTLRDLVSYNEKHNLDNGEKNRDGTDQNESWNCGVEGPTPNLQINELRERQMRNFLMALLLSQGVPMLLMGDEYGHTKKGNNNTWCQDNELNWMLWNKAQRNIDLYRFTAELIALRHRHPILRHREFLTEKEVTWHGVIPFQPNWDKESRFLAYCLHDASEGKDLYIAFNAHWKPAWVQLPPPPDGKVWARLVDTSMPYPQEILAEEQAQILHKERYQMAKYSSILLKAR